MFQWWKKKRLQKKNRLENKLKQEVLELEEALNKQITLYTIKTKQYNDFMVEAEIRVKKWKDLLEKEKTGNGKLLIARTKEIGNLKEKTKELEKQVQDLSDNNNLLKNALGHF